MEKECTFNKEPGSGPPLIHATSIFTFIIRSAFLDDQSAQLSFLLHAIPEKQPDLGLRCVMVSPARQDVQEELLLPGSFSDFSAVLVPLHRSLLLVQLAGEIGIFKLRHCLVFERRGEVSRRFAHHQFR